MTAGALIHAVAVAVAVDADGPLAGALLLGEAGTGKSSLALALIECCPFRRSALVADDAVLIEASAGALFARAPERLGGLIEIRGFGPVAIRTVASARLRLAADLGAASERTPDPAQYRALGDGVAMPLYPFLWRGAEATAPHRLRRMIAAIVGGQNARRTQDSPTIKEAGRR